MISTTRKLLASLSRRGVQRLSHRCIRILGIESSCDDTGVAIVNDNKDILGESLHSQGAIHRELGGIVPTIARDFHKENVRRIVDEAFEQAQLTEKDIDAVAVSVKPGLTLSLKVGLDYAKKIAQSAGKPLIPIHHMEAHALTARITHEIEFPYLVLLMSGGHCLLAVVEDLNKFSLLGTCIDTSPGDMLDKTARRLRLKTLTHLSHLSGGAAIEHLALTGDHQKYKFPDIMGHRRDCNFSFSGLQFHTKKIIGQLEAEYDTGPASVLPTVSDICASVQHTTLTHMAKRLYRAFLFCEIKELLPESNRTLVLSGGVASNSYFRQGLAGVAEQFDCKIACPPARLCTDNGVMIAWNGVEKYVRGIDILQNDAEILVKHKSPLGVSLIEDVYKAGLKVTRLKLNDHNKRSDCNTATV